MKLSTEDRQEINDLYASYAQLIDAGESEKWAGLFTPDAAFRVRSGGGAPDREVHGTAELVAWCQEHYRRNYGERQLRHGAVNILVKESDNGAQGTAYATILLVGNGQPAAIRNTARYVDDLVKGADGWRFQCRTVIRDDKYYV